MAQHFTHRSQGSVLPAIVVILGLALLGGIIWFLSKDIDVALLNPKGVIAEEQYLLLLKSTAIMFAFALPVALFIYFFAWLYREDNQKTAYSPITKERKAFLAFAWGGPITIVIILAAIMIPATHQLAHQKPIESDKEPLTIQVVALNWKWLFIYPEQHIASLNFVQIPVDRPIRFELTADGAPMSSFWVPHLGGMLYVMTGHVNPINLMADEPGDYPGNSAEINGRGFADMKFITRASTEAEFEAWVAATKRSPLALTASEYDTIREPSENVPPAFFRDPDTELFSTIVSKYAGSHSHENSEHQEHGSY